MQELLRAHLTTLLFLTSGVAPLSAAESTSSPGKDPLSLSQLKAELAQGTRTRFPAGTVERNGDYFLLVSATMTWSSAEAFAEAHGAHLAILPEQSDQQWFRKTFPSEQSCWLGAGKSANEQWQWIDGSPWVDVGPLPGDTSRKRHVHLTKSATIGSASETQPYQVALQWRDDGSNPGTLESQLARTAASAAKGDRNTIQFPIGTLTYQDSHFFYLRRALSWNDARLYAASLGATLAIPSSSAEHIWIGGNYQSHLEAGDRIWLGGFRLKPYERWQWINREPWNNAGWDLKSHTEADNLNRLVLAKPAGSKRAQWLATDGQPEEAHGLLLEWSAPPPPGTLAESDWKPWFDEARDQIGAEVRAELMDHQKRRKTLVAEYVSGMKATARSESKRRLSLSFDRSLSEAAARGRLVDPLPAEASDQLRSYHNSIVERLTTLEANCERTLRGHLTLFTKDVEKRSEALAQSGFLGVALRLKQVIAPISEDSFTRNLIENPANKSLPWARK